MGPFEIVEPRFERIQRMISLYRDGKTLEDIGFYFGITRERVRQLICPFITAKQGGRAVTSDKMRVAIRRAKRERDTERCLEIFGCDLETARLLNDGKSLTYNSQTKASAYLDQRRTMTRPQNGGWEWRLSFPEWIAAWGGNISRRGKGKMALVRRDPTLGFFADNVHVQEMKDKASDTLRRTRTRLEHIRSLLDAGLSKKQVAEQLGLTVGYIEHLRFFRRRLESVQDGNVPA